ncbi:MAG: ABC transporter permease [Planctomycetota bacterium]
MSFGSLIIFAAVVPAMLLPVIFLRTPVAALCRRELYTLINGPIGLVSFAAFLLISQSMFATVVFAYGEAGMRPFFEQIPLAFTLVAPLVAMRMWADERRGRTLELLLTLPIRTTSAVFGKFLAGWIFLAVCLAGTLATPLILDLSLTAPNVSPDWGPIAGGYFASLLLAAFTLAIGSFASSLTQDQIVAAIGGVFVGLLLWTMGMPLVVGTLNGLYAGAGEFLAEFSHQRRFLNLAKGLWDWTDALYFVSGTFAFLWLTTAVIEKERG